MDRDGTGQGGMVQGSTLSIRRLNAALSANLERAAHVWLIGSTRWSRALHRIRIRTRPFACIIIINHIFETKRTNRFRIVRYHALPYLDLSARRTADPMYH